MLQWISVAFHLLTEASAARRDAPLVVGGSSVVCCGTATALRRDPECLARSLEQGAVVACHSPISNNLCAVRL
jgi:hypothetical protein